MATCTKCGKVNYEGIRFCTSCGSPLPVPEETYAQHEPEREEPESEPIDNEAEESDEDSGSKKKLPWLFISIGVAIVLIITLLIVFRCEIFGCDDKVERLGIEMLPAPPDSAFVGDDITFKTDAEGKLFTWDFGDGLSENSMTNSISHKFEAAGKYLVKLCLGNVCDSLEIEVFEKMDPPPPIDTLPPVLVNSNYRLDEKTKTVTITFKHPKPENVTETTWVFGDGVSKKVKATSIAYTYNSVYKNLTVSCTDNLNKTYQSGRFNIQPPPPPPCNNPPCNDTPVPFDLSASNMVLTNAFLKSMVGKQMEVKDFEAKLKLDVLSLPSSKGKSISIYCPKNSFFNIKQDAEFEEVYVDKVSGEISKKEVRINSFSYKKK